MAEKDIIMQRKKADGSYDKYYPRTKVENVEGAAKQADLAAHQADYVLQVPYGATTGSANTYAVTLDPAPSAYTDGMALAIKINVNNTGASTINVNGLGAKSIKKSNGNNVSSGNLKAGSIYTLRYNGTNFILQGEGGEYGTAQAGDVLSGKTIGTEQGIVSGTMPNRGAVVITPGTSNKAIQAGYHNGNGYVKGDVNLVPANIVQGKSIFGVNGSYVGNQPVEGNAETSHVLAGKTFSSEVAGIGVTGTMPNRGAVVITPGTSNKAIVAGYHNGSGYVKGDANLIPANIVLGKTIFGVVGTYAVPGNTVLFEDTDGASEVIGTTFELYFQYTSTYTGIIRFFYSFYTDVSASCQVHLNGVPVGAMHIQEPGTDKDYILDMYINVGDKLQIYAKQNYGAAEYATYLGAVKIYC